VRPPGMNLNGEVQWGKRVKTNYYGATRPRGMREESNSATKLLPANQKLCPDSG